MLYLFHSQTSTSVYLAEDRALERRGNFPINTLSDIPVKQKQACVWRDKQGMRAAHWLALYRGSIFWQASLPVFLFDITYLWVEQPLTGGLWILSTRYETHLYTCRPVSQCIFWTKFSHSFYYQFPGLLYTFLPGSIAKTTDELLTPFEQGVAGREAVANSS